MEKVKVKEPKRIPMALHGTEREVVEQIDLPSGTAVRIDEPYHVEHNKDDSLSTHERTKPLCPYVLLPHQYTHVTDAEK